MSLRVESQNSYNQHNQNKVDHNNASLDVLSSVFKDQMKLGGSPWNWKNWDGYKLDYDQFDKNVKIEETDDSINAEVDDKNVEPRELMEQFVSWFKDGFDKFAKSQGKAIAFAQASMVVMSLQQAMSQVSQPERLESSQLPGKAQLPSEIQKALADAAVQGPKQLAETVKTLVAQNHEMPPAIAAAAMKEAAKANPATAADAAAQIVESAVQANPQAAPQIAASVAQAATENLSPEKAAEVLGGITKAAAEAAPSQGAAVAGEVAQVAVKNLPSEVAPKVLGEITKAAVQANPEAAPQIAEDVAEVATKVLPENEAPIALGQIAESAAEVAPGDTAKIADSVSKAAIENLPAGKLPEALTRILEALSSATPEAAPVIAKAIVDLLAKASSEDLASVIANMASKFSTFPQPLRTELENTLKGIEAGATISGKPAPAAASEVGVPGETKQKSDKAEESAASDYAANFQGAQVQTDFNPRKVEVPREQKAIPGNLLKLIAETVSNIQIDETQTTITLQKTPELPGDVTLVVRMENGRLEVNIKASDPQSAQLLQDNRAALQSALQAGSGTSSVSVTVAGDSEMESSSDSTDGVGEGGDSKTEKSGSSSDKKVSGQGGASTS